MQISAHLLTGRADLHHLVIEFSEQEVLFVDLGDGVHHAVEGEELVVGLLVRV
eukprot:NODE_5422_length_578_cov_74.548204_g4704_i0.p4 GENE.NODE_5422_length_578_cov_74.548204_g4704_i0~~NODE_5422_length_578_cov_74.548204_g4704_i0.p4  ORF type:complete len:53 (+),score=6.36 NODE_5422_length_578_cov_74.548204_g4704_i0:305-463(+)